MNILHRVGENCCGFFATKEKNCQGQKMGFLYSYMTMNVRNYCGGNMNESDSWAKCK